MSLPPNTSAVTLVSITAETPCNNRNVGNAEKSIWPSYRNLRSLGLTTVLPTAIASSTLLACHVGTHTYIFKYNITHHPVHTEPGHEGCNETLSLHSSAKRTGT